MAINVANSYKDLSRSTILKSLPDNPGANPSDTRLPLSYADTPIINQDNFHVILDSDSPKTSPIQLVNCKNFTLSSKSYLFLITKDKFFIELINCSQFSIRGLNTVYGENIILISGGKNFSIKNCKIQSANGYGIVLHDSDEFSICQSEFMDNTASGVFILGNTSAGDISNCSFKKSNGFLNAEAGLLFAAHSSAITLDNIPRQCHEAISIQDKACRPHTIHVTDSLFADCRAQGIYLEGAVNCLFENNILINNNKEGICLDWGSCYNIFKKNTVALNGNRSSISQQEIAIDFIADFPILQDGSSSIKLPGISFDNSCLNRIENNTISSNYGGGIKMVRSSLLNSIQKNLIIANDIGKNDFVPFFHGVSFLSVGSINDEFDEDKSRLLDFIPSNKNTLSKNTIKHHEIPIFNDRFCQNNITANTITQQLTTDSKILILAKRSISYLKRQLFFARKYLSSYRDKI